MCLGTTCLQRLVFGPPRTLGGLWRAPLGPSNKRKVTKSRKGMSKMSRNIFSQHETLLSNFDGLVCLFWCFKIPFDLHKTRKQMPQCFKQNFEFSRKASNTAKCTNKQVKCLNKPSGSEARREPNLASRAPNFGPRGKKNWVPPARTQFIFKPSF